MPVTANKKNIRQNQSSPGFTFFGCWPRSSRSNTRQEQFDSLLDEYTLDEKPNNFIAKHSVPLLDINAAHTAPSPAHQDMAEDDVADSSPIRYYENSEPLYRGMRLSEEAAFRLFKNGMQCTQADLDTLSSMHTSNYGISTSKFFGPTLAYAAPVIIDFQMERGLLTGGGWVFEIDPTKLPAKSAIDIMATSAVRRQQEKKRGCLCSWSLSVVCGCLAVHEQEVNIIKNIPAKALAKLYKIDRSTRTIEDIFVKSKSDVDGVPEKIHRTFKPNG